MNKLHTFLLTITSLTTISTNLWSSEKAYATEMNVLRTTSYAGGAGVFAGAVALNALQKAKQNFIDIYKLENKSYSPQENAILAHLNKGIKNNKRFMGVSFIAILAPIIVPSVIDQFKIITGQNEEPNKNLSQETA